MASDDNITTTLFPLNTGTSMPAVGLGTYRIRHEARILQAVDDALAAGYRLFDTAAVYHNEAALGKALKQLLPKYNLQRDDIFITTKLAPGEHGSRVEQAYKNAIDHLGVEYVDLFLIHFPGLQKLAPQDGQHAEMRHAAWQALVKLYDDGRVNAIGVSNFTVQHLKDMMKCCHGAIPAVNQVEWHPFYYQTELLNFCKKNDIVLQAYSSFGGASISNEALLKHPVVTKIARKLDFTNAQVLLAWALHQDVAVIPKSTHPDHIKQNIRLNFKIPSEDIKALDELGEHNTKYAWDPRPIV